MGQHGPGRCREVLDLGRPPGITSPESAVAASQYVGFGEVDPETGLHEWYEPAPGFKPKPSTTSGYPELTWTKILAQWVAIEADFQQFYGLDVGDNDLLGRRSWRWMKVRILGLLAVEDSRLQRIFAPPEPRAKRPR